MTTPPTVQALDELYVQLHTAACCYGDAPLDDMAEQKLAEQFITIGQIVTQIDPAAANYVLTTALEKVVTDVLDGKLDNDVRTGGVA